MSQIVGIDLGTTNSLCAVFRDGTPQLIPNPHGDVLTPSVVGLMDDGQMLVGIPARELRVTRPEQCCSMFKRYMGSDRKLTLGKKSFSATELSSLVLRSLKEDAEAFLGEEVTEAVITVPAYFNDLQRKATRQAGEIAGFKVRRIVNEPTAAALTYGFHDRNADKKLIVIDLGGGTFDVTLLEIFEGTLEIVSTAGESFLGGEDFTDRLAASVLQGVGLHLESVEVNSPLLIARLRQECEAAKRKLGTEPTVRIRIPDKQGAFGGDEKQVEVSHEEFAKLVHPLVERVKGPIGKVLRDASCGPDGIEDVILVGGATRMPVIKDMIAKYFLREPLVTFNPDEVVALGAAVQAALIVDDAAVDDMVMTDVCPFTLGIEVVKSFGRRKEDGYYSPIIHRNTTIPVSREEVFNTVDNNQTEVLVSVFQGESRHVKDNLKLGELRVTGIPPGPAGQSFCVRFTYDLNGILEVEAYVPQTRKKFNTVLKNHARDLSPDEIKEAVERMQGLKFYPRDDVANQRLVLFVERMVGEVSPHQREQLEGALDYFEASMSSGDRTMFQSARAELMTVLANLGMHYEGDDAR